MIKAIGNFLLTFALWLLAVPLWVLWQMFSELCDWTDRRGQRRYRKMQS